MRILLSGGVKTGNIKASIEKKFESTGDVFIIEEFLENIVTLFGKGEYFDKALITEQSITRDFKIKDETEIRIRINTFIENMKSVNRKMDFVFLTRDPKFATIIDEETFTIHNNSVIVVKEPKYSVPFFYDLIVKDIHKLPSDIVFKPELIEAEDISDVVSDEELQDLNGEDGLLNSIQEASDFDMSKLIEEDDTVRFTQTISDDIKIDSGIKMGTVGETDIEIKDFNDEEIERIKKEQEEELARMNDNINISKDEAIDLTEQDITEKSGEIPDPTERVDAPENRIYLEGFDDPEDFKEPDNSDDFNIGDDSFTMEEPDNTPMEENIPAEEEEPEEDFSLSDDFNIETEEDDNVENPEDDIPVDNNDDFLIDGDDTEEIENNEQQYQQPQQVQQTVPQNVNNGRKIGLFGRRKQQTQQIPQQMPQQPVQNNGRVDIASLKRLLSPFASRGNSIVFISCGGSGNSFMAYNTASVLNQLGYKVLLVDMDTQCKTQSYISKNTYDNLELDEASLMQAVNSNSNISDKASVIKPNFHLLTMGIGSDAAPVSDMLQKDKLGRFISMSKGAYDFVVYDVSFQDATTYLTDLILNADNTVITVDTSQWGITKFMLLMSNIGLEDIQNYLFSRAQILFNKYRGLNKLFGQKVKTGRDITNVLDKQLLNIIGEEPDCFFRDMYIADVVNDDINVEQTWFTDVDYAETPVGQQIFLNLAKRIILKEQ